MPCSAGPTRSEEHTSELQSLTNLVCRLLLEKKKAEPSSATTRETRTVAQRRAAGTRGSRAAPAHRLPDHGASRDRQVDLEAFVFFLINGAPPGSPPFPPRPPLRP